MRNLRLLVFIGVALLGVAVAVMWMNDPAAEPGGVAEADVDQPAQEPTVEPAEEVVAIIPSRLATELFDEPPEGCGRLAAYFGNPGGIEILYTISDGAEAGVYAVRQGEHQAVWTTQSAQMLEIAGFRGWEVFLVFTEEPFESPADAWSTRHTFSGLDLQAPGVGVYPSHLDAETIEAIRATLVR